MELIDIYSKADVKKMVDTFTERIFLNLPTKPNSLVVIGLVLHYQLEEYMQAKLDEIQARITKMKNVNQLLRKDK